MANSPSIKEKGYVIRVFGDTITTRKEIKNKLCSVQKVIWTGASAAGHACLLSDKDGDLWAEFHSDAPGTSGILMYTLDLPKSIPVDQIFCEQMDSGSLFIYLSI